MQIDPIDKKAVDKAKKSLPPDQIFEIVVEVFKALGDATRLKILYALQNRPLSVRDIAIIAEISESAISHQLSHLKEKQLVKSEREGNVMYYSISYQHVHNLLREAEYYADHILKGYPDHR